MENEKNKQSEEILAEIYRNAQLALQSIHDILPQVDDEKVKQELKSQYEEYERFSARAACLAKDRNIELKEPNMFKKAMMWGSIKMSSLSDNSRSHIADMMLQGTVMGISALRTSENQTFESANEDILSLLKEMIAKEEEFEKIWKTYL